MFVIEYNIYSSILDNFNPGRTSAGIKRDPVCFRERPIPEYP